MKKILGVAVAVAFVLAATAVKAEEQKAAPTKAGAATTQTAPTAKVAEPTKAGAAATTTAKTEVADPKAECLKKFQGKPENDPAVQNCIKSAQTNVAKAPEPTKAPAATEKKAETTGTQVTKPAEQKKN